jgi:hypothetical protein
MAPSLPSEYAYNAFFAIFTATDATAVGKFCRQTETRQVGTDVNVTEPSSCMRYCINPSHHRSAQLHQCHRSHSPSLSPIFGPEIRGSKFRPGFRPIKAAGIAVETPLSRTCLPVARMRIGNGQPSIQELKADPLLLLTCRLTPTGEAGACCRSSRRHVAVVVISCRSSLAPSDTSTGLSPHA